MSSALTSARSAVSSAACFVEKRRALSGFELECGVQQRLEHAPAFARKRSRASSKLQSRRGVRRSWEYVGAIRFGAERLVQQPARLDPVASNRSHGDVAAPRRSPVRSFRRRTGTRRRAPAARRASRGDRAPRGARAATRPDASARGQIVVERDMRCGTAALLRGPPPRAVDENVAHRDGGDAEKVRAIPPVGALRSRELEIELVHERRRRQRVARTNRQLAARGATQLVINEGKHLIERFAPASAKITKKLRDAGHTCIGRDRESDREFTIEHCQGEVKIGGGTRHRALHCDSLITRVAERFGPFAAD